MMIRPKIFQSFMVLAVLVVLGAGEIFVQARPLPPPNDAQSSSPEEDLSRNETVDVGIIEKPDAPPYFKYALLFAISGMGGLAVAVRIYISWKRKTL